MKLFNREICFCDLPQSDIVVFDESHLSLIANHILKGYSFFVYNMRPEKIYISASIICQFFKSLRFLSWSEIKTQKRKPRALCAELIRHYRMGCFMVMKPKVVITVVDNFNIFHWLSRNYKEAIFFAIQNGHRTNKQLTKELSNQYISNFFCFGGYDKDRYSRFGHVVDKCYPIGSLKLGIYGEYFKKNSKIEYDVSIISQFRENWLQNANNYPEVKSQILMHEFLLRCIKESKIKAALIMSRYADNSEIGFFKNIYNDNVDFIGNDRDNFTSYSVVDKSNVIVGFNSTLISEAFGMGKKVLRIDFTGSDDFNDYDPIILLKSPSYSVLKSRLNELLSEPYEDYKKRTKEYAAYIMNYDSDCPPHRFIREKIEKYL